MFIVMFLVTLGISLAAQFYLKRVYARHNRTQVASGCTGVQVARAILTHAGIHDVRVQIGEGLLSDHYDPMGKRLVLSEANFVGASPAALGVAAHECGHALQHQQAYAPLKLRMAAVNVTNFASQLVLWVPLLGAFTGWLAPHVSLLIMAVAWGVMMAFNLITLPVEFDASRRAKAVLGQMGFILPGAETVAVNAVLRAAAWTYVAAFVGSLVYFLWHLLALVTGRNRN